MNKLFSKRFLASAVIVLFGMMACKSSDNTIVITDAPTTSGRTDSTIQQTDDTFQQLAIGEITPLRSLDPLFADNIAGLHAAQLLYEGLVQYDENGEIGPAIARDWNATDNNTTYRFMLNTDIFYHDSDVFSNGLGRKLTAADVRYVFERMAKANVPRRAAQLFMNIDGFEPYYQEQQQVFQAQDRQLESISGIRVVNDSTITFSLSEPDPEFLNKLATPWASIYPKEAVTSNGFKAVGTGPFKLSQKRNDALYIFSRFEDYRLEDQPELNRVDVQIFNNSAQLSNALSRGDVHLIPQLSPQHMATLLNAEGELSEPGADFRLQGQNRTSAYFIRYHEGADLSRDEVTAALQQVNGDQFFQNVPADLYQILWPDEESSSAAAIDSLTATHATDPFITTFYDQMKLQLADQGIAFGMSNSRVANRNTALFAETYFPIRDAQMTSPSALITLILKTPGVSRNDVEQVKFNNLSWWIDLRQTTVPTQ